MRPTNRLAGGPRNMHGAGLIEVMVAVLILAIGLLGIAAMQAMALRNSQSALERSQGVVYTYAIADAMRANRAAAGTGAYDIDLCDTPGSGTLAANDLAFWLANIQADLGDDACGAIDCNGNVCSITVQWNDTRGSGGVDDFNFVTEVAL